MIMATKAKKDAKSNEIPSAKITFKGDKTIQTDRLNLTLLSLALQHEISHLHACGSVARCSTCQVKVLKYPENLTPRSPSEEKTAKKRGLPDDVRLACQTKATGPVTVERLFQVDPQIDQCSIQPSKATGQEIPMAVLFSDIRGFTRFTSEHMAHDVIHLLNRYFHMMGEAIDQNNGYIHQYYGDGIMALFGFYARDPYMICLDAVNAAMDMLQQLEKFNEFLEKHFERRFEIGIGIHFGEVLAAKIGHPKQKQLTVLGEVVNMASRVESATKEVEGSLLISNALYSELGPAVLKAKNIQAKLPGITKAQNLYEVKGYAKGFKKPRSGLKVSGKTRS